MRESRSSGSVEGVVSDHDPYSDSIRFSRFSTLRATRAWKLFGITSPSCLYAFLYNRHTGAEKSDGLHSQLSEPADCAVKGAVLAFIAAKRIPILTGEADGSGAGFQREGQKREENSFGISDPTSLEAGRLHNGTIVFVNNL